METTWSINGISATPKIWLRTGPRLKTATVPAKRTLKPLFKHIVPIRLQAWWGSLLDAQLVAKWYYANEWKYCVKLGKHITGAHRVTCLSFPVTFYNITGKLPLSASQTTNPQSDHKTYAWAILLTDISNIYVPKRDQVYIHVHFRIFLASFIYFECVLNVFIIVWRLEDCNVMGKCWTILHTCRFL